MYMHTPVMCTHLSLYIYREREIPACPLSGTQSYDTRSYQIIAYTISHYVISYWALFPAFVVVSLMRNVFSQTPAS